MDNKKTPLHAIHVEAGAKMTGFAGYEMPIVYPSGVMNEHLLVRHSAGLFDISHMGRIEVHGREGADALSYILSADVRRLAPFQSSYALMCAPDGGILDDVFVYRLPDRFLIVVNAANRISDMAWMREQAGRYAASFRDISDSTAMIALQGPTALDVLAHTLDRPVTWPRFYVHETTRDGITMLLCRTGYTGEEGVEIICPSEHAAALWRSLQSAAETAGIDLAPVGLAARDSLRFEPGFPLYGHELTPHVSPVEARLLWACSLEHNFIGREAIISRRAAAAQPGHDADSKIRLVSFIMVDAGVPRHGCAVYSSSGEKIGWVTTGMRAPTLEAFAGNAYVMTGCAKTDSEIFIEIRGRKVAARIARRPLYRPSYRSSPFPEPREYGDMVFRHIGPDLAQQQAMLEYLGCPDIERLLHEAVPRDIRLEKPLRLPDALNEQALTRELRKMAGSNIILRSLIGQGYSGTVQPAVIRRNILENPAWYTQYTPYQAEISQGRLEALLNFQSMIIDLTGLEAANASLLDEATAAAEAMLLCRRAMPRSSTADRFFIHEDCHPQTIEVVIGRAEAQGIHVDVGPSERLFGILESPAEHGLFGGLFQYPACSGNAAVPAREITALHAAGARAAVAADLL
ncbi:MAG: glycine cleavage system aminomethyltransferase GcvT, partial [Spirochaeta sp.]